MYPSAAIPEPTAFMYPRWGRIPWARGSYSNWPPGTSLLTHQNLRANVGRLWFAGEATSVNCFGFLHGAGGQGNRGGGRRVRQGPVGGEVQGWPALSAPERGDAAGGDDGREWVYGE
jgi:hypothetical protein